jgi:hypothetical protein
MAVPFDTHAVIQTLEQLGFPTQQAEGLSAILTRLVAAQDYATKADVVEAALKVELKIEAVKGEVAWLKWMVGTNIAMTLILLGLVVQILRILPR